MRPGGISIKHGHNFLAHHDWRGSNLMGFATELMNERAIVGIHFRVDDR